HTPDRGIPGGDADGADRPGGGGQSVDGDVAWRFGRVRVDSSRSFPDRDRHDPRSGRPAPGPAGWSRNPAAPRRRTRRWPPAARALVTASETSSTLPMESTPTPNS